MAQFAVEVVVRAKAFPDAGDAAFGVGVFEAALAGDLAEVFTLDLAGERPFANEAGHVFGPEVFSQVADMAQKRPGADAVGVLSNEGVNEDPVKPATDGGSFGSRPSAFFRISDFGPRISTSVGPLDPRTLALLRPGFVRQVAGKAV
jgi:hypothetical protein